MLRDNEYLLDILEAAKLALSYVSGKTREEFLKDTQCQDAVIRRLEIIGEASRRLSGQTRAAFPHLPWQAMAGMRNILIHEYDGVDLITVWDTVRIDLPAIISALQSSIPPEERA
jgi:uncharacterized protein with HEPN domain